MSYGYVYVAQIAMGANMNQTIKAMVEAESYKGPSLIIAYSPCISHGIKTGMGTSIFEEKRAVEAGYWHLYRYNPMLKEQARIRLFWSRKNRPLLTRSSSREKSDIHSLRMYSRMWREKCLTLRKGMQENVMRLTRDWQNRNIRNR